MARYYTARRAKPYREPPPLTAEGCRAIAAQMLAKAADLRRLALLSLPGQTIESPAVYRSEAEACEGNARQWEHEAERLEAGR
jgi:hypothetical protein